MMKLNTRSVLTFVGVIMGLGGATHGSGEILQGNVAPSGVYIQAWPALTQLAGEPAMTLIPNFLVTGVLAIILGLAVAVWAAKYLHWKNGGLGLIALSLVMLLLGGGIMPPMIEVATGLTSTWVNRNVFGEANGS
jgi:hypothetical protein